jgi:hypothetical protein
MNHIADGGAFEPNQRPMFLAWDRIPIASVVPKGKCEVRYHERFKGLVQQFAAAGANMKSVRPIPTRVGQVVRRSHDPLSRIAPGRKGRLGNWERRRYLEGRHQQGQDQAKTRSASRPDREGRRARQCRYQEITAQIRPMKSSGLASIRSRSFSFLTVTSTTSRPSEVSIVSEPARPSFYDRMVWIDSAAEAQAFMADVQSCA